MTGLFKKGPKNETRKLLQNKKNELKKLVKKKKYEQVFKIGSEILEKNPHDHDVLFIIGGLHFMQGNLAKSISFFDRALEISEFDPDSLLLKAKALFKLGKFDDSKNCCKKIQEIDPKNKDVLELLQKISEKQS